MSHGARRRERGTSGRSLTISSWDAAQARRSRACSHASSPGQDGGLSHMGSMLTPGCWLARHSSRSAAGASPRGGLLGLSDLAPALFAILRPRQRRRHRKRRGLCFTAAMAAPSPATANASSYSGWNCGCSCSRCASACCAASASASATSAGVAANLLRPPMPPPLPEMPCGQAALGTPCVPTKPVARRLVRGRRTPPRLCRRCCG